MKMLPILTGCLLVGFAAAQDPVDPKPTPQADAQERMSELQEMRQAAVKEWRALVQKAQAAAPDADGSKPAVPMAPDFSKVTEKAFAYAEDYAGTDEAVPFLLLVVNGDREQGGKAMRKLIDEHVDSAELASFGRNFGYLDQIVDEQFAAEALAKLEKSKNAEVRGWAMFARLQPTIAAADTDGAEYKEAKQKLMDSAETVGGQLASQIRGAIDEREQFGIGCVAPDIVGIDLDGVAFKLSDYKGKVLFVDFWGDW